MKIVLPERIQQLGPGLITAALIFGPGSLTVGTKLGAGFGYKLLWVIPILIVLMVALVSNIVAGSIARKALKKIGVNNPLFTHPCVLAYWDDLPISFHLRYLAIIFIPFFTILFIIY